MRAFAAWIVVVALVVAGSLRAANPPATLQMVPAYVSYQGRLVDSDGNPYSNTMHRVELRLYDSASGGNVLWGEEYTVRVQSGFFALLLGAGGAPIEGIEPDELWRVLWSSGGTDDQLFMGLTVLTDVNGAPLSTPVEATPRQQFVTAPFAFRAHQSRFAGGATDEFMAQQGINTPSITSTQDVLVTQSMRITGAGHELRTSRVEANENSDLDIVGASGKYLDMSVDSGRVHIGVAYPDGEPIVYADQVQLGHNSSGGTTTYINGNPIRIDGPLSGGSIRINARNGTCDFGYNPGGNMVMASGPSQLNLGYTSTDINIRTDNLKINSYPMFDFQKVLVSMSNGSGNAPVSGISSTYYNMMVVGFSASYNVRSVYISNGTVYVNFGPDAGSYPTGGTAYVRVLGIRKGLVNDFTY